MLSRRALIRTTATVGGGVAVTALVSACSDSAGQSGAVTEPFSVSAAEVPVGGGIVLAQHRTLITQPTAGEYHAFSAECTHKGCLVSEVQDRGAYCGCHSSYFDISTGAPVAGPAPSPLPERTVTVNGDQLDVA